jgi:hypothetical protein
VAPRYLGFVSVAGYDAVVAIEGGHGPYVPQRRTHRASSEAAAATAAYEVLRNHFPASSDALAGTSRVTWRRCR